VALVDGCSNTQPRCKDARAHGPPPSPPRPRSRRHGVPQRRSWRGPGCGNCGGEGEREAASLSAREKNPGCSPHLIWPQAFELMATRSKIKIARGQMQRKNFQQGLDPGKPMAEWKLFISGAATDMKSWRTFGSILVHRSSSIH
jgi:hypothetical protein